MNTEAVLKQKRLRTIKRHFAYEMPDEPQSDAMKRLEVSFFNAVVDCTIRSLEDRFQSLGEVRSIFRVLFNFGQLDAQTRKDQCKLLSDKLTFEEQSDIDGSALATEMENLPELPKEQGPHVQRLAHTQIFVHEAPGMRETPHAATGGLMQVELTVVTISQ